MAGRAPEEVVRRAVVHQGWHQMTMLHWRFPVESIAPFLPSGLQVDTFDGSAWVSLTPFLITGFRVGPLPSIPRMTTFPETNLRTYARSADGVDGLWFLSLEVDSLATTVGARVGYGVP